MSAEILNLEGVERQKLKDYTEKAYLDYSMYVILDRALPHVGDGLKPVQRRIIYAMSELGLNAQAKFKKSARTIGDVLGKFHPHGDSACYEAMVLMAQPFSYRYPFISGQGNWGSQDDPKSFAAMRYTEAKLSKFASSLLSEVGQGTVEWVPNFDGTLDEPKLLPARLPNVILNGTTGIAVGMATDIPPHNLTEVGKALVHIIENPNATLSDIMKFIKGPDYPTSAEIITSKSDIKNIYKTGHGSIKMRAVYELDKQDIIITHLPHMVSGAKVIEQIAGQMQSKKLPMIVDLRDESDHENPTRIVLSLKSKNINHDDVMLHLFASTDLERSYRVNMNMIGLDGRPKVFDLVSLLNEWLSFRISTVTKRLEYRLSKVKDRLHILDGLMIAFLNIDEVIKIIREKDNPREVLMKKFKITKIQAEAILELKLRHLAKLEEVKIKAEQKELSDERDSLEKTLGSKAKLNSLVKKEIEQDVKEFDDSRRSKIVEREEAKVIKIKTKVAIEPISVILSSKGWIRAAKGHDIDPKSLSFKSGDDLMTLLHGTSLQQCIFFDSNGRSYNLDASSLPSARGHGEPLTGRLSPEPGSTFDAILMAKGQESYLLMSNAGYGFIVNVQDLLTKNKKGKSMLNLPENAKVVRPFEIDKNTLESKALVAILGSNGRLLVLDIKDVPILAKGKGKKLFSITANDWKNKGVTVVATAVIPEKSKLTLVSGRKKLELSAKELKHYKDEVGTRGHLLPKGFLKTTDIIVD